MNLYSEKPEAANHYRKEILAQMESLIKSKRSESDSQRERFFDPDFSSEQAYEADIHKYRRQFKEMLGWPLTLPAPETVPSAREKFIAEDDLGRIYRIWIETLPGLETYGLLFLPLGKGPHPLIISQHGGGGTPELCSGFLGSANYNDMSRRVLRRGFAVFAPQLSMWRDDFGPTANRNQIDIQLKQIGGSIAALDIWQLQRSLDLLTARKDIDDKRIGMIGLSWGGFYTLITAAVETRIQVAVASCFFSNRYVYDMSPAVWFNSGNTFLDAEIAGMVCPRSLYIEVGKQDELFDVCHAQPEAQKVAKFYDKLGIPERFIYKEHEGGHELDKSDNGIQFLSKHLQNKCK